MTKQEIIEKINEASTIEEVEELRNLTPDEEVKEEETTAEKVEEAVEEISKEEERNLINKEIPQFKIIEEDNKMEERKFTLADAEYRNAFAKTLMGVELEEVEKRALGDAVGTTATTYVASSANTQGINNLGLLIPKSIQEALLERLEKVSPIFRDVRKMGVKGHLDLPYLHNADDANWYVELTATANEGQEYKKITLTGHELAKDVVITWKAEQMTIDGFIDFIIDELYEKMYKAKVNAIIYGPGSNQPTGLTNGLTAVTMASGDTFIDLIKNTFAQLSDEASRGAKAYVSTKMARELKFYKDENGNYPYLVSNPLDFEVDPFLANYDVVVGNMRNYIWNEQEAISVSKEVSVAGRKVTYGAYQICDGSPKPNCFAYATYTPAG